MLVYLSDKPNLFEGKADERIGRATIKRVDVKKVKELTEEEARQTGISSLKELKQVLKKWYDADDDSAVTYVGFGLTFKE